MFFVAERIFVIEDEAEMVTRTGISQDILVQFNNLAQWDLEVLLEGIDGISLQFLKLIIQLGRERS